MKVCIIGGLKRREQEYMSTCKAIGCSAKVFNTASNAFDDSIRCSECVVFLTALSSHNMMKRAKTICRKHNIPFLITDRKSPESIGCLLKEQMDCRTCPHNTARGCGCKQH